MKQKSTAYILTEIAILNMFSLIAYTKSTYFKLSIYLNEKFKNKTDMI